MVKNRYIKIKITYIGENNMDLIIREAKVQDVGFISEICSVELDYVCNKETVKNN